MDALESSLDGNNRSILRCLRSRALKQSLPVYLVGGPVRDVLMGRPINDLDFTVEGDGPEVARWLAGELGGEVLTHSRFGTATLVMGPSRVDVVTARQEIYPQPAELPQVSPGTISDDLARRDFSINAMALPLRENHPEVLDPHGGVEDLRSGLVRVLHPNSFVDDPTRILRAVRYEQRLEYRIEDETLSLLHDAVRQGHLACLTGDRLRHELERILDEERPELALKRAVALELLAVVHPLLGDGNTMERLEAVTSASPTQEICPADAGPLAYLAALAYPLSRADGEAMVQRLSMSSAWAQAVQHTILLREREEELATANLRDSQLVDLVQEFCDPAVLSVSRLTSSPLVAQRLADYLKELRFVVSNLNGSDLLVMGMPAGPEVGRVLRELREAKLDGSVSSEADERRLVQRILTRERGPSGHG